MYLEKKGRAKLVLTSIFIVLLLSGILVYGINETNSTTESNFSIFLDSNLTLVETNSSPDETIPELNFTNISDDPENSDIINTNLEESEEAGNLEESRPPMKDNQLSLITLKDHTGKKLKATIKQKNKQEKNQILTLSISEEQEDKVEILVEEGPVKKIEFEDLNLKKSVELGIDDVPENIPSPEGEWEEVYAIDPTQLNFTNATVTVTATGNRLYKCKDWDFPNQKCDGEWTLFKTGLVPGQEYTFILTADDPGFGEIIATDAVHMYGNYTEINNIYSAVETLDGMWSEPIYAGEIVRVTFAENLTNGRIIDVYVRSNWTLAYFDIYEAGTQHKVASSGIAGHAELQYMIVKNLTQPMDTFDFKIVKVEANPEDDSPNVDPNVNSFLEFDYIHDDVINTTQADGIVVYSELNVDTPRYRIWNSSITNYSAELVDTQDIVADTFWSLLSANHERDEMILATIDSTNDVNIQIFNSTKNWGNLQEVSQDVQNSNSRGAGVAYEDLSGDALIVYENTSGTVDNLIRYQTWNGTNYSAFQVLYTDLTNSGTRWIDLVPKPGTDEIMVILHNNANELYALLWNGSEFNHSTNYTLSTGTTSNTEDHFEFIWESSSRDGLIGYGESNDFVYREYNSTNISWGPEQTIALGNGLDALRFCADPTSDHIGIIIQDGGNDLNVRMWDGDQILSSPPTEDALTEPNGAQTANMDCGWQSDGNLALFSFIDQSGSGNGYFYLDYLNFTKPNTWSTSDLTATGETFEIGQNDIDMLRFTEHPTTNEIMIVAMDINEIISTLLWNGTAFVNYSNSLIETASEVTNGNQEAVAFDWYRYDTVPAVTSINPNTGTYGLNTNIDINASVTDNINVSAVLANITYPNGTIDQITLTDLDADNIYNNSFIKTGTVGIYTLRIIANDTSTHKNTNSTETTTFTLGESTLPAVFNLLPTTDTNYNVSDTIEVAANVTDNVGVSIVLANISYPNGTIDQITLTNVVGDKYNTSFTAPNLEGNYDITLIANDTSNNINNTETSNFTVAIHEGQAGNYVFNGTTTTTYAFLNGTFNYTRFNDILDLIELNNSNNGTYTSEIFDAGSAQAWNNISWIGGQAYLQGLPDSAVIEDGIDKIDMDENVLLMHLDESSGTIFDTSGKGNNGTNSGATYGVNGKFGTALDFSGSGDYVQVPDAPSLNLTENITVEMWLNADTLGLWDAPLIKTSGDNWDDGYGVYHRAGTIRFWVSDYDAYDARASLATGSWYHVVGTFDGANVRIYVNGVEGTAQAYTGSIDATTGVVRVGSGTTTAGAAAYYFDGDIDEAAIYNRSLSAAEILDRYKRGLLTLNLTVRSCDDANCAGESFEDITDSSPQQLSLSINRYFQYQAALSTDNTSYTPELYNLTIQHGSDVTNPSVFNLTPSSGSSFSPGANIEISANVTDDVSVTAVLANVTYPNGTVDQLTLMNVLGSKYNTSFTAPAPNATYTIRFIANDTTNNINSTETSTFIVSNSAPSISSADLNSTDIILNDTAQNLTLYISVSDQNEDPIKNITDWRVNNNSFATLYMPFEGNSNSTYTQDYSTNGNNGTVTGATFNQTGGYDRFGAYHFDGNDYIQLTDDSYETDNVGTISAWINPSNPTGGATEAIFASTNPTDTNNQLRWYIPTSGVLAFQHFTSGTGNNHAVVASTTLSANTWYHVVLIANSTAWRMFVNGQEETVTGIFSLPNSGRWFDDLETATHEVVIGRHQISTGTDYFNGIIDDFMLFNRTLSDTEITLLYENRTDLIASQETEVGETWQASVTPSDGKNDGTSSLSGTVTILDAVTPSVNITSPTADTSFNVSTIIEISADVTDNDQVDIVLANITYPNTTINQLTLTSVGGDKYNVSFTAPALLGTYNVTFIANDTSNNINSTETTNFTIVDGIVPSVTFNSPAQDASYLQNATVTISVNVSDDVTVSAVLANITYPNTTITQKTLTDEDSDGTYNITFNDTSQLGDYTIRIIANDTSNNINSSETRDFSVQDSNSPLTTLVSPTNNLLQSNSALTFVCNATDNNALSNITLYHNITGTFSANSTNDISGTANETNFTINNIPDGIYLWNCLSYDSSANNAFASTNRTFSIDTTVPNVTNPQPDAGSTFSSGQTININASVSDNLAVSTVLANITLPNGSLNLLTLSDGNGDDIYTNQYTIPELTGTYNITFIANDTANNINNSETTNFTASDGDAPNVTSLSPAPTTQYDVNTLIEIAANVTDEIGVDTTLANITYPNGTIRQLTLTNPSGSKYNISFTIPALAGDYDVLFIANDTNNNINNTETTNFTALDNTKPSLSAALPQADTDYNVSDVIEIATNATDNVGVSIVSANITYPNGTIDQITLSNVLGDKYNVSFTAPALLGTYNITFIANDTSNNINNTETTNFTVIDIKIPTVSGFIPAADTSSTVNETFEIAANITDDVGVSIVLVNITYPNTTINQLTLSNTSGAKYNISFTAPALLGTYNITFIANDTSNNINSTETTNFTIIDTNSLTITALGCLPLNINLSQTITCNATASDDIGIDTVAANVTLPNGTVEIQSVSTTGSNYTFSFSNSILTGQHNITWWVNDTSNNQATATASFNMSDVNTPSISLNGPVNTTNLSTTSQVFNFTALDNYDTSLSCSLILDGITNQTNSTTLNATASTFSISGLAEGNHDWNISCTDTGSNSNTSETRRLTVDLTPPGFASLTTTPDSEDDLDPNINITILANITENITGIDYTVFQYKLNNETDYTNLSMFYNPISGSYNSSFNASVNGSYNLRVWANDSSGNSAFSNLVNITVELDLTWSRTPSSFSAVSTNINTNISLGNLTVNNTGDYSFTINITSDSTETVFNDSSNFTLAPGEIKILSVNDSTNTTGTKTITLNITATPNGNPVALTTTGTIVAAPGQPVINTLFTTPSSDTLSITQGATEVQFISTIDNIGEGNATNVTLYYTLPSDWTITFGDANTSYDSFDSGESESVEIQVSIPSNATAGTYNISVNATVFNQTGSDMVQENLVFGDRVVVTINEQSLGSSSSGSGGGGGDEESSPTSSTSSGGGGGSSGGGAVSRVATGLGETLYTTEILRIPRGEKKTIPITVTNLYENAYLEDVDVELQGFMSQYVTIEPTINLSKRVFVETKNINITNTTEIIEFELEGLGRHSLKANSLKDDSAVLTLRSDPVTVSLSEGDMQYIDLNNDREDDIVLELRDVRNGSTDVKVHRLGAPDPDKIHFREERDYLLSIFVPAYLEKQDFNLTLKITANIVAVNTTRAGFAFRPLTELRSLLFVVHEIGIEEAEDGLAQARLDIQAMQDAGFPTTRVSNMLAEAEVAINESRYEESLLIAEHISRLKRAAFQTDTIVKQIQEGIEKTKDRWLQAYETEKALNLVSKSFEREDFETALQRAKNAQLVFILETKGKVNVLWFITTYWWGVLLGLLIFAILGLFAYRRFFVSIINQRLRNLDKEERVIAELLKDTQIRYLKGKFISPAEYHKVVAQYEDRLHKIKQIRLRLRNKRTSIFNTEQKMKSLEREERDLIQLMKKTQKDYLVGSKMTRKKFLKLTQSDTERIAKLEEEREMMNRKLEKQKIGRFYKLLSWLNNTYLKVEPGFIKKEPEFRGLDVRASKLKKKHTTPKKGHKSLSKHPREVPRPSIHELIKMFPTALTKKQQEEAITKERAEKAKKAKEANHEEHKERKY